MNQSADHSGIVHVRSSYLVAESMDRFERLLKDKALIVFVRIDQQREADKAGLTMRPTQLILFGNPKAGTVLMNAVPNVAIDLPLKVLAWEDEQGHCWLSYNDPAWLQSRHGLTDEQVALIAGIAALVNTIASPSG